MFLLVDVTVDVTFYIHVAHTDPTTVKIVILEEIQ